MPGLRSDWPFSARAEELHLLNDVVLEGTEGPANAVIFGAAGVGKSRLARAVADQARARDIHVVSAIATRATGRVPYGALAHLAPGHPADYDDLGAWYRAFAGALARGEELALLVVDDAQWLDDAAAALLLHLAEAGAVRLLLTVRRGEPVPEPVTTMWKDAVATRIDLQPLSARDVGALVSAALGGDVAGTTAAELAKVSGGNVLFVRELVEAAVESGAMARVHDIWRWDGSVVLAPRLSDLLRERLGQLSAEDRRALAVVALGEPLGIDELREVAGEDALTRLERDQLVRVDRAGRGGRAGVLVTLGHPLYGDIVVDELAELERRRLVVRLADAIEARGENSSEDQVKVATWRVDAGAEVPVAQLVETSVLASRSFAPTLGERLASVAIASGGGVRARIARSRALVALNRFEEAEAVLAPLEEEVLALDDADVHEVYLDRRHAALYMGLGRDEEMLGVFDRFDAAHAGAELGHRERAATLVRAYRSAVLLDQGRLEEVVGVNLSVLEAGTASPLAQLYALENASEALFYLGRTHLGAELIDRLEVLGAGGDPDVARAVPNALMQRGLCLHLDGRQDEAMAVIAPMLPVLDEVDDPHVRGLAHLVAGAISLRRGTVAHARAEIVEAIAGFRARDAGHALAWSLTMLCQAEALRGDGEGARAAYEEALGLDPPRRARMIGDFAMARARLQSLAGDLSGAARTALDAAADCGELLLPKARLLHEAVQFGAAPAAVRPELDAIADAVDCGYPAELRAYTDALARGDGKALEAVAAAFGDAGSLLYAAETAAQAARAYERGGLHASASRAVSTSHRYAGRCEGAHTPAMDLEIAPVNLSPRELEVARLVADGLSNTDVAARLTLSVRTVESHLYRVFAKLGVTQRSGVAAALRAGSR